jgi:hypothetical protein
MHHPELQREFSTGTTGAQNSGQKGVIGTYDGTIKNCPTSQTDRAARHGIFTFERDRNDRRFTQPRLKDND